MTTRAGEPPFVSIIIVNYNGRHFLDACLSAIVRQTYPRTAWEVIVVDNGSTDGSVTYVREQYPWVRLIDAGRNLGFAGGNNVGIRAARGQLLALLNNDTIVDSSWLQGLVEQLGDDPTIGGVASKILLMKEPGRINSAGLVLYRDGRGGDRGFRQPDDGRFDQPAEVFGPCGASALLRRTMLDDVGLFDERFFMYYEDLDLAWRARLHGWRFVYAPQSTLLHVHCGSSGEWSPFFLYHVERNRVFANVKNAPAWQGLRCLAVFGARALRQWGRVLFTRSRSPHDRELAFAYLRSALSLMYGLPIMLLRRLQTRWVRQCVPDRVLRPLMARPPARSNRRSRRTDRQCA
jgi:GT2 family glycosyltransferase